MAVALAIRLEFREERYEAEVPDTLDLAERARIAINALTRQFDPELDYEICEVVRFNVRPPYMYHTVGDHLLQAKYAESLPMMRVMSGSVENLGLEEKVMKALVSIIAEDGLMYAPANRSRIKGSKAEYGVGPPPNRGYPESEEDYSNVYGDARMMLAMMAWYQRGREQGWRNRIQKMAEGLAKAAIYKEDYAYYPEGKVAMEFSHLRKSGWEYENEPAGEREGHEGSIHCYHGGQIRALSRWYSMSGDSISLELARKLVNFVLLPKFWRSDVEPEGVVGHQHAHFQTSHLHCNLVTIMGLLEYAIVTNNERLKSFARDGYEYARNFGIPRIGLFNEGCTTADMLYLAIKLSDAGVGDYWEDVDQYVRNHLVEMQLTRADLLEKVSESGPERALKAPIENADKVIERTIGAFAGDYWNPTALTNTWIMACCTGNCTQALYYTWEAIVRCRDDVAQINLLLNRASPWLDLDSYLPYEGKVIIKNKRARKLSVRIPRWVNKKAVKNKVNLEEAKPFWVGNYLVFDRLEEKDVITIEFPMVETTEKYTLPPFNRWKESIEFTCYFKGNTLVDILPREEISWRAAYDGYPNIQYPIPGYPIYQREHYKRGKAPMKRVERYVSPAIIEW